MKIGYVNGVNNSENEAFLETLSYAYNYLRSSDEASELEIITAYPELAGPYSRLEVEYAQSESLICEQLCDAIKDLDQKGAQDIIVPFGAQLYFPQDYITEETGRELYYTLYKHMRNMVKGIARRDGLCKVERLLKSERLDLLASLGVMGLSGPAERFSSSDYLEEHIEKTSYSLFTPTDRVKVWGRLSDAFYGKEMENDVLRKFCYEEILKMDNVYRSCFGKNGLQGLFVTDFWTENLINTEFCLDKLTGQVTLPNGTVLPVLNLERIEAWAIAEKLLSD